MLQVFKSFPVVEEVHRAEALPEGAGAYARDAITLGWEERLRSRGRRRSDGGLEFGTSLPRGTTLRAADCLVVHTLRAVVVVVEREEPVLVVEPRTPAEWGLFGYYIGNSHQPVMLTDRTMVCPDILGMAQVLEQHRISFVRARCPFTPVGLLDWYASGHQHLPR